ncbi:6-phosphogluconolactonase [Alphaproteobacteria bacterium KMM 3653]|uniref:6-phosphogluconolactonase n=1 Tax=Harenicola maris TaxID=2841044 RepID=A0AAP2G3M6_9RHOB|nr:6-phosphogluconolactonase [Harenicola maris]
MKLIEYAGAEALMTGLADRLGQELTEAVEAQGRASFAVPGGSTPGPMFDAIAQRALPWDQITVMLTDERRVPQDSERSNTRLLRERLLVGQAASAHYAPIVPEVDGADLTGLIDAHLPLSVLLLGMGEDMHTASLFPGSPDLPHALAAAAPLMYVEASDGLEPRVTLTGPALQSAQSIHILIKGEGKRAALDRAAGQSPETAPIQTVLPHATVHWAP